MSKEPDPELSNRLSLGASDEMLAELDEWRRRQATIPTRAAAARMLLKAALKGLPAPPGAGAAGTGKGSGTALPGRAQVAAPAATAAAPETFDATRPPLRCEVSVRRRYHGPVINREANPAEEEVRPAPVRRGRLVNRPRQLQ